jgi:DNA-binding NarL/FixJ family response regulator
LADDQILFAETLRTLLNNYAADLIVIGIAGNGGKAVAMTREHRPDIILMDVRMPVMDGVEAVKTIKQEFPNIKIIVTIQSLAGDSENRRNEGAFSPEMIRLGAKGGGSPLCSSIRHQEQF